MHTVYNEQKLFQLNYQLFYFSSTTSVEHVPRRFKTPGEISLKNTVEDFKLCDKKELINQAGKKV